MTHDKFCNLFSFGDVNNHLCNCFQLELVRADEREQAAQRVLTLMHIHDPIANECDWCDALFTAAEFAAAARGGERA